MAHNKVSIGILGLVLMTVAFSGIASAHLTNRPITSYGNSSISFPGTAPSVTAGNTVIAPYLITRINGTGRPTEINLVNGKALTTNGINVTVFNNGGSPTFNGTMRISTSKSTAPGTYQIWFNATGGDPAPQASLLLSVGAAPVAPSNTTKTTSTSNSTTKPTTTTTTTPTTTPTTTTSTNSSVASPSSSSSGGSSTLLYVGIIVVIIIIAAAAYFMMRKK